MTRRPSGFSPLIPFLVAALAAGLQAAVADEAVPKTPSLEQGETASKLGGARLVALTSPAYRYAELLAGRAGILVYAAKPWSVSDFRRLIAEASRKPLSPLASSFLKALEDELAFEPFASSPNGLSAAASAVITPGVYFSLEAAKNDASVWTERKLVESDIDFPAMASAERFFSWETRPVFLSLPLELAAGDAFAALIEPELRQDIRTLAPLNGGGAPDWNNVPWPLTQADMYMPRRAYLSASGPWWRVHFGRDQLRWGSSEELNLLLSDTGCYYDQLGLTLDGGVFRFSSAFVSLDAWSPTSVGSYIDGSPYTRGEGTPWRGLAAHNLEIKPWPNLSIALSESYLIASDGFDPLVLANPLMIFHNWFLFNEANSLFCFDSAYSPLPGTRLWGQYLIDEFSTAYESEAGDDSRYGAGAFLIGASAGLELGPYYVRAEGQFARSDPWFGSHATNTLKYLNLRRQWSYPQPDGYSYLETPIGFRYGGDARVWELVFKADSPLLPSLRLGLRSVERGWLNTYGKLYVENYGRNPQTTVKSNSWANSIKTLDVGPVERTLTLFLTVDAPVLDFLTLGGGLAALFYENFRHQAGRSIFDLETNLYIKGRF